MTGIFSLKLRIGQIDLLNRAKCSKLLDDNKARFEEAPGSLSKHQAWKGGYIDHLVETMNIASSIYFSSIKDNGRELPFTLGDVILILFLHDLEKPFKYVEPKTYFGSDHDKEVFINSLIDKYEISLSEDQKNALKYIHGESSDFSPTERIQSPLAAFCNICDVFSARIWFDYPK